MTERKPAGMSWESFADRQFREAEERGEFKDLPGFGKPLPGAGEEYDELWWVKSKLQREGLTLLPPSLALRKEVEVARERIPAAPSEAAVRRLVEELNAKIVDVNARTFDGPPSNVVPLNVEAQVQRWAEAEAARRVVAEAALPEVVDPRETEHAGRGPRQSSGRLARALAVFRRS